MPLSSTRTKGENSGLKTGSRQHFTQGYTPYLVWHTRQPDFGYYYCFPLHFPFLIPFLYFILHVKPWLQTSQGAPPPHQPASNAGNGNPSRSVSFRSWKGRYRKRLAIYPTSDNKGIFPPSFFILLFPTRMPLTFYRPILHCAVLLHTAPPLPRCRPQRPPGIDIGTLNI